MSYVTGMAGKKVIVTRPEANQDLLEGALSRALLARGAEVFVLPMIEVRGLTTEGDRTEIRETLTRLGTFRWLLLTSAQGVRFFFDEMFQLQMSREKLKDLKVAAIGKKTALAIEACGWAVDLVAEESHGEGLFNALLVRDRVALAQGAHVLLARAKKGRAILPTRLTELGARVTDLPLYETVSSTACSDDDFRQRSEEADCVTFTSPSTVEHYFARRKSLGLSPRELARQVLAAIGPVTEEALQREGFRAQVVAGNASVEALAEAIEAYYRNSIPTIRMQGEET